MSSLTVLHGPSVGASLPVSFFSPSSFCSQKRSHRAFHPLNVYEQREDRTNGGVSWDQPFSRRRTRGTRSALVRPHAVGTLDTAMPMGPGKIREHGWDTWGEGKRLQCIVTDVGEDTVTIRSLDWDRDRFDIEFGLQEGTTYNAYIIFGSEKTALVDASHEKFRGLFMKALSKELESRGRRTLDYVLVSHTEPDHSGLVPDVVAAYPNATVVGSKVALTFLDNLARKPFPRQAVKGGDKIDLGGGHVIEFVMAPNLHWPDTMFSYDHQSRIMFTCDAFGMHYCAGDPFDSSLEPLMPHYRFYYDCLMRPNAKSVLTALRKVKDLPYEAIANGHGPMLKYNVAELVNSYKTWSEGISKSDASVAVLYSAEYGFSDRLSQTLAKGVTKAGVATEMVDLLSVDPQDLVEIVGRSAVIVLLAPPDDSAEARASIGTLLSALNPKKHRVVLAESYGGMDEPVDQLRRSMIDVGIELVLDPLRVREKPSETVYQLYEEAGTDIAQAISQKDAIAKKKAAMSPAVAKALARVSGGLYIVTAGHAESNVRGAMVASWVAQASFEPLGLTVAVAKDRAIESLMQVGDKFVLNCLGEGSQSTLMKHFLQRFPAGADRFAGVNWSAGNASGVPILDDAIAYVECEVKSRMETADHWITYAEVKDGGVGAPEQQCAVHRRIVANYY